MSNCCDNCGKEIGVLFSYAFKTSDNYTLCTKCVKKFGFGRKTTILDISSKTFDQIKNYKSNDRKEPEIINAEITPVNNDIILFRAERTIADTVQVDLTNRMFKIKGFFNENLYSLDKINSYELIEDGQSLSSGGLGSAAIGGMLFGGSGAIVGALAGNKSTNYINSLRIKINMSDLDCPIVYIHLIKYKTKKNSMTYNYEIQKADAILSSLNTILSENNSGIITEETSTPGYINELKELKSLLDADVITTEEFETKKKQILNL